VHQKEGLALITAIRHFHVYLASTKFTVYTDNMALTWIKSLTNTHGRLLRWALILQAYNFDITHKPGRFNVCADALSRRVYPPELDPEPSPPGFDDSSLFSILLEDQDLSPDPPNHHTVQNKEAKWLQVTIEYEDSNNVLQMSTDNTSFDCQSPRILVLDDMADLQRQSPDLLPMVDFLASGTLPDNAKQAKRLVLDADNYFLEQGILYHLFTPRTRNLSRPSVVIRQLVVPISLRPQILQSYHDDASHLGSETTYANIKEKYFWDGLYTDVHTYITSCERCQFTKRDTHHRSAPLLPIQHPEHSLDVWAIDYLSLPITTEGYDSLLVCTDPMSKWIEAFPTTNQTAATTCDLLYSQIICRYGVPTAIRSDRGQNVLSGLMEELCKKLKIKRFKTTSFHPMSNGSVERVNGRLLTALRTHENCQTLWPQLLPGVLQALRATTCVGNTLYSSYELLFGRPMRRGIDVVLLPPPQATHNIQDYMQQLNRILHVSQQVAEENIRLHQEQYKLQYDKRAAHPPFQPEVEMKMWEF
jgi:transposase InsO family protein